MKVYVEFDIKDGKADEFEAWLQKTTMEDDSGVVLGYRSSEDGHRREALEKFANEMEIVLRRHDHKTGWRERKIEALVKLMYLEIEEFKVAFEFFEVKDARKELVDTANFCLIVWDRLSLLDQDKNAGVPT